MARDHDQIFECITLPPMFKLVWDNGLWVAFGLWVTFGDLALGGGINIPLQMIWLGYLSLAVRSFYWMKMDCIS